MKVLLFAKGADRPHQAGHYVYANLRAPLVKAGHEIIDVNFEREMAQYGKGGMHERLKNLILHEQPDLFYHVIFEDELDTSLASFIRDETPTTSLVFFSDDDWRLSHSLEWVAYYNVALTTSSDAYTRYKQLGHDHVLLTPYACNPDWYYPVSAEKTYDVTFVGQAYQGRPELLTWLKSQGVNLQVWGTGWEEYPDLRDIAGGFLPHFKMLEVFGKSRIVLGLAWCSIDGKTPQIKGRTFEYPACQAFQLAYFDKNLENFYHLDQEVVTFKDQWELLEKIKYFLANEKQRQSIVISAYQRTMREHTWERRYATLFNEISQLKLHSKKPLEFFKVQYAVDKESEPLKATPKVAIFCYVFNGEAYIEELIESVLGQTFRDFEFLILDDGSTDDTKNIIGKFLNDPRIRYVYQENIGKGKNFDLLFNRCVELTHGDLICAVGGDDVLLPEKVARQFEAFEQDPDLDVVFTDGFHIDSRGQTLTSDFRFSEARSFSSGNLLRTLFHKNIIAHPTVMLKRTAIERMGGFEGGFATDYQFWLKSASHLRFKYLDEKLLKYRIHAKGASTGEGNQTLPETIHLLWNERKRCSILELYPEIRLSANTTTALYRAYVQFGNSMLTANIPVLPIAIQEFQRALQHRPGGIEALNNLGVSLWLAGEQEKSREVFLSLEFGISQFPIVANNRRMIKIDPIRPEDPNSGLQIFTEVADEETCEIQVPKLCSHSDPKTQPTTHHGEKGNAMPACLLVSVIVPTFDRPDSLKVALQSIMQQTLTDFEVIVINDAGVDVEHIVASFNARNNVTSIRHGKNRGLAAARNSGLGVARGKYIAYLDDDDRFLPNHLETLVNYLEGSSRQVAYSDAWRVWQIKEHEQYVEKKRDVPYSHDFNPDNLLVNNYFPVLCVVHEKACLERSGVFDETLTTHEDWDLWIRLSRHYTFDHVKQVTAEFTWRTDGSSMTSRISKDFLRTKRVIYEKCDEYFRLKPDLIPFREQELRDLENRVNPQTFPCSIIIPVFNKMELTQQCLMHLAEVTQGISYEVVIVDNHSTDGTIEFLASLSGDVQVIRNSTNLGFAKACNQGARAAKGQYLVFLNNDTIPRVGWLEALVHEVDTYSDVDVVGSKLLYPDNTIQHAGVVFSRTFHTPYHLFSGVHENLPAVNVRREFQAVTAACMLVRKETFEKIGGFDEGFVNGFEDVDLCLRVRQMGKKVIYQPKSCLYHLESQTPGRKKYDDENLLRLIARWKHQWLGDEDFMAAQNDYIIRQEYSEEPKQPQLIPKYDVADSAVWQRAVDLQKLLLGRECQPLSEMTGGKEIRDLLVDVEGWPNDIGVLVWVGDVCERLKLEQEAVQFWQKLLTVGDHAHARLGLARTMLKNGNLDEAQIHLETFTRRFTPRVEGWLLTGYSVHAETGISCGETCL